MIKLKFLIIILFLVFTSSVFAQRDYALLSELRPFSDFNKSLKNSYYKYTYYNPFDTMIFQVSGLNFFDNIEIDFTKIPNLEFDSLYDKWMSENSEVIVKPFFINILPSPDWQGTIKMADCLFISERDTLNITAIREGHIKFDVKEFTGNVKRIERFGNGEKSKSGFMFFRTLLKEEIEDLYQNFLLAESEAIEKKLGVWKENNN